jgi:hypothetical protein
VVSFQGHRLWIDGMQVANTFSTSAIATSTTPAIHLVPGWHDFVADVTKQGNATPGQMSVTIASGPQWAGQPIPVDHIRPVSGRGARWIAAARTFATIPDGGSISRLLTLTPPFGFVPELIEVGYEIDHPQRAQVSVVLDPPVGANVTLVSAGSLGGAGSHYNRSSIGLTAFGASWSIIASDDTADAITGSIDLAAITAIGHGGIAPFPTSVRYESAVRELGEVVAFGAASWQLRQGSTASVQLRTCDEATCTGEPWTDVINDTAPANAARRFAQYAVSITTDGDVPTALDWFELIYSVRPE